MPETLKFARQVLRVFGFLGLLTAAVFLFLVVYGQFVSGHEPALKNLSGMDLILTWGVVIILVSLAFGFLSIFTASGIAKKQKWSWISGLFLGLLLIPLIPLGTIFGVKVIFCLVGQEARDWFQLSKSTSVKWSRTEIETRVEEEPKRFDLK